MRVFVAYMILSGFLTFIGLYWFVCISCRFFYLRTKIGRVFPTCIWFPLNGHGRKLPVDCGVGLLITCALTCVHIIAAFDTGEGNSINFDNIHMAVFYGSFTLHFVIAILKINNYYVYYEVDFITLELTFIIEVLMFSSFLHEQSTLKMCVYSLLIFTIISGCICLFLEILYPNAPFFALCRSYCTLVQGSWLGQMALFLYPPESWWVPWGESVPSNISLATTLFSAHCLCHMVLTLITSSFLYNCIALAKTRQIVIPLKESSELSNDKRKPIFFQFRFQKREKKTDIEQTDTSS